MEEVHFCNVACASLPYRGSVLWNSLPLEVQHLTSLNIFRGKY